jgi:hypothetical protein
MLSWQQQGRVIHTHCMLQHMLVMLRWWSLWLVMAPLWQPRIKKGDKQFISLPSKAMSVHCYLW